MAEAVAVISLLSSIVQLVEFGTKLIDRFDDFASATEDVPVSFRSIKSQLPLAIITLRRVEDQARSGCLSEADAQAPKLLIDNSLDDTTKLTEFLDSAVPVGPFSTFQKRLQALKSLKYDKVQKCAERLRDNGQILIFHQIANQGKMAEAEEMYQRALAGKEKALGPDHMSTLTINCPALPSSFSSTIRATCALTWACARRSLVSSASLVLATKRL